MLILYLFIQLGFIVEKNLTLEIGSIMNTKDINCLALFLFSLHKT